MCFVRVQSASGQSGNYNGFEWEKSGNAATITGYTGPGGVVTVPGTIPYGSTNLSVTSIGQSAFFFCLSLTNVVLGSGVTNIGSSAFAYCENLAAINIPNGVTSIGEETFGGCGSLAGMSIPGSVTNIGEEAFAGAGLTNVSIGSGVTTIGDQAFSSCFKLPAFTVDPSNTYYSSLGGVLFDKRQTTLIQFPAGAGAGDYDIPDTVTNIGDYAFVNCTNLTSVTIPDSVTSIDTNAFLLCVSLTNVTIGSGLAKIGGGAFALCYDLRSIYFRGNAPAVDSTVFSSNSSVTGSAYDTATAYYLPGTTNWSVFAADADIPATLWLPQIQSGASGFGVQANQFGFNISWASGQTITIEACTNLFSPDWQPLQTNTLTSSSLFFSDPLATNYPSRFYRIISP